jgi:hypothetical protein
MKSPGGLEHPFGIATERAAEFTEEGFSRALQKRPGK